MRWVLGLLLALLCTGSAHGVSAATLYLDAEDNVLKRGDSTRVSVRLDVDEASAECINAASAEISYGDNIVPVDVSLGRSIFALWVERPTINEDTRTITFAGGMPNGYCGRVQGDPRLTNVLVDLIFRSPGMQIGGGGESATATIAFTDRTEAYRNDGFGTKADLRTFGTTIGLSQKTGTIQDPWQEAVNSDEQPPEPFSIALGQNDRAFGGRYYISFNTTDKQTGLEQYQVMEEPNETFELFAWGAANAPWITAESPYVLQDQTLNSVIRVRALDKAGNEYVATLVPEADLRSTTWQTKLSIAVVATVAVVGVIVLGGLGWWLYRRHRRPTRDHADAAGESDTEAVTEFGTEDDSEHSDTINESR